MMFRSVIKKHSKEKKDKRRRYDVCRKPEAAMRKTHRNGCSQGIQKALARREQLQISQADACPHMQLKSRDQSLRSFSL